MQPLAQLAQVVFGFFLSIALTQAAPQGETPPQTRSHMTQDQLCCITSNAVTPVYPREARLAGIQGQVKLLLVIGENNSIAKLQAISGDPLLVESTMKAVRQWKFVTGVYVNGAVRETEVPLTFTFKIEDPPRPAYLHLKNNKVIRADDVREFPDCIQYTTDGRTHHISADSVTGINACARASMISKPKDKEEANCIPGGGPSFVIRAIPLLPADKTSDANGPTVPSAVSLATETWVDQRIEWKYGKEGIAWKTTIKSPNGQSEYQLKLQPLWAVEGGVVALEIVVARPNQPDANVLGERETDIEYPFVITVEELENGLEHSKFGAVRNLAADGIALKVKIEHFRLGKGVGSGSVYCAKCKNLQELSVWMTVESKVTVVSAE
jgi:TonB family protein